METFGYNLKDNLISLFRQQLVDNLHFAYGSRSGVDWGSGALIYTDGINKDNASDEYDLTDPDTDDYFICFFDEDIDDYHLFKVIKAGQYTDATPAFYWNSNWVLIDKFSKSPEYFSDLYGAGILTDISQIEFMDSISLETLISQQTSSNISKNFKLYKLYNNSGTYSMLDLTSYLVESTLNSLRNTGNNLFNAPLNSKLISIGNSQISTTDFQSLKFITNISDGSYSKCYNLSLNTINKIQTQEINIADITFELVNDYNITIVSGLKYKALIQISNIDYAVIMEYATDSGSKNLVITTENFIDNDGTEQLGIFLDSSSSLINTNDVTISPVDTNLVNNSLLKDALNFNRTIMDTGVVVSDRESFFKYLWNDAFINHNQISTDNIYFVTKIDMSANSWDEVTINEETYWKGNVLTKITSAEAFNIKNLLIEINLATDFSNTDDALYDLKRDSSGNYKIHYDVSPYHQLNSEDFKLREIALYFRDGLNVFHPMYYSRTAITLNANGEYNFKIIL